MNKRYSTRLILALCLVMYSGVSEAVDYGAIPLSCLIGTSDGVILGSIIDVLEGYFIVAVERVISGAVREKQIKVRTFKSWSRGIDKIKTPQSVLLLLRQDKSIDNKTQPFWKVQGITGEGKLLTDEHYVYFTGIHLPNLERCEYRVGGVRIRAQRYDKEGFITVIEDYNKCFTWEYKVHKKFFLPQSLCEEQKIDSLRKKSILHRYLFDETQKLIEACRSICR